jgi:hypothetical protein
MKPKPGLPQPKIPAKRIDVMAEPAVLPGGEFKIDCVLALEESGPGRMAHERPLGGDVLLEEDRHEACVTPCRQHRRHTVQTGASVATAATASEQDTGLREAQGALRALIEKSLARAYISTSSYEGYKTGNRYQTVRLGDEDFAGFRNSRRELFAAFDFSGRTVLDCGSNIGEMSRLARSHGAWLVDGYELDGYFVAVARMINALNGVTRVSFYEKDLTDPSAYQEGFDVALAFSVYPYVSQTLPALCAHVNTAIILETHNVKPDLYRRYIEPFRPHFPYHTLVGLTDHGDGEGRRAIVALAKSESSFREDGGLVRSSVDVQGSRLPFLSRALEDHHASSGDPVAAIARLASASRTPSAAGVDLNDKQYWCSMASGYLAYREHGAVSDDNPYMATFKSLYEVQKVDPELSDRLKTSDDVRQRILRRFKDIDSLSKIDGQHRVSPIQLMDCSFSSGRKMSFQHGRLGHFTGCDLLDGHHRLFWARFFGVRRLDAIFTVGRSIAA